MSSSFQKDPVNNAIYQGIKRGITTCLDNECFGSALILTYSGIDTMAYLGMPQGRTEVTRSDFIEWCEMYMRFPCTEQLTGLELYSARCATVHTYGVESRLTHNGQCRKIGYMSESVPEIRYSPTIDPSFVLVSIESLASVFLDGVDRFMVALLADSKRSAFLEQRLNSLLITIPNPST